MSRRIRSRGLLVEDSLNRSVIATKIYIVLGINGQKGARRLVRALLADPLAPKSQWEKRLLDADEVDGKALLVRYGLKENEKVQTLIFYSYHEDADFEQRHPLVRTLSVPSSMLLAHKLEIFIQAIPPLSQLGKATDDGYLVPGLEMKNSAACKSSTVRYPVHKALILAEGLENIASLGLLDSQRPYTQRQMEKGVIDASWSNLQDLSLKQGICPINLATGEFAIESFRKSLDLAVQYEHAWFDSGLANLTTWLLEGLDLKPPALKPTLQRLIETVCHNAEWAIHKEREVMTRKYTLTTVSPATRALLQEGIIQWAEFAHTELRDQLDHVFLSRSWKKLAWWKLFWRVDDVGFIVSDVLQRAWLIEAEKEMIWHSGRFYEAGLGDPETYLRRSTLPQPSSHKIGQLPPDRRMSDITTDIVGAEGKVVDPFDFLPRPWPQEISHARASLFRATIPPLQALSQSLLLQTISTTVLTSCLSTILYVSVSTTSVYEAGAIAAIGFVYSMRRLQKEWSLAREAWVGTVREEGRKVLRAVEEGMRAMLMHGGKGERDEREIQARSIAWEGVKRVREDLKGLEVA